MADGVQATFGKRCATNTPGLTDFGTQKLNQAQAAKFLELIATSYDFYKIEYDCIGRGNFGMTYFHTTILNEKRGDEGLVNFQHTHILKTNDAGLLTMAQWQNFAKIPIKDTVNTYERMGLNAECDISAGEEAFKVLGRGKSLDQCKKACETTKGCKSLTFYKGSGYCSLFKTICTNTKKKSNAVALRLVVRPPKFTGPTKFVSLGLHVACKEGFIFDSPGRNVATLDECKSACKDHVDCLSFTYFRNGYCSLHYYPCDLTVRKPKAQSFRLVESTKDITEAEVLEHQKNWGNAILTISKTYKEKGDYLKAAEVAAAELYGYGFSKVLFKPTKAAVNPFRPKGPGALSYFVGGTTVGLSKGGYAEDHGFAHNGGKGWSAVRFDNHGITLEGNTAYAMGHYYFTCATSGKVSKVEYSFGYKRVGGDGKIRVFLHHSSVPYQKP